MHLGGKTNKDQMKVISNQIGKHTEKKGIKICQRRETTKKRQKNKNIYKKNIVKPQVIKLAPSAA